MTDLTLSWQHDGMRPTAYRRNARGLRDRQAFEGVRMQAGALFAAGHRQAEVARTLGVARQNVSRWDAQWQAGGLQALANRGPTTERGWTAGPTRASRAAGSTIPAPMPTVRPYQRPVTSLSGTT